MNYNHQLTLGELIYELKKYEPKEEVRFDFGYFEPGAIDSYRGYYEQLAISYREFENARMTVGVLLEMCKNALGNTFTGYKGGDYVMSEDTPLWASNRSDATGTAIVGVTEELDVVIHTAYNGF